MIWHRIEWHENMLGVSIISTSSPSTRMMMVYYTIISYYCVGLDSWYFFYYCTKVLRILWFGSVVYNKKCFSLSFNTVSIHTIGTIIHLFVSLWYFEFLFARFTSFYRCLDILSYIIIIIINSVYFLLLWSDYYYYVISHITKYHYYSTINNLECNHYYSTINKLECNYYYFSFIQYFPSSEY